MLAGKIHVDIECPIFILPHSFRLKYILYSLTRRPSISQLSVSNIYPEKWNFFVKRFSSRDENNVTVQFNKPLPYAKIRGYFFIYGQKDEVNTIIKQLSHYIRSMLNLGTTVVVVESTGIYNIDEKTVRPPYNMTVLVNNPTPYSGPPEKLFIERNGRILVPVAHLTPKGKVIAYQPVQAFPSDKTIEIQSVFGTKIANPIIPFPQSPKLPIYIRKASEFLDNFNNYKPRRDFHRHNRYSSKGYRNNRSRRGFRRYAPSYY